MKRLTCKIQVGDYTFVNRVSEVTIKSSFDTNTDTATIIVPNKVKFKDKYLTGSNGLFKPGDKVVIALGYDHENREIFHGFVSGVKPGFPLELHCEDYMYLLKKGSVSKAWPRDKVLDVADILKEICPSEVKIKSVKTDIKGERIDKLTPSQYLLDLNKRRLLKSWFRNDTLYVGLAWWPELQQSPEPVFKFFHNIIEDNLTYQEAEDVRLKVTATSIDDKNKTIQVIVGDPEGEERSLTYYGLSEKELKEAATRDMERLRYSGFRGNFSTFGMPYVNHGDRIKLVNPQIPDKNGLYIVRSVETTFGQQGFRQRIELGEKV